MFSSVCFGLIGRFDFTNLTRGTEIAIFNINGEIGAQQGAQSAIHTIGVVYTFRRMVSLSIGVFRHDQHVARTKFHTKSATFAAFFDNMNNAARNLQAILIKRFSPEAYITFPN